MKSNSKFREYGHILSLILLFTITIVAMYIIHDKSVKMSSMLLRYSYNNNKTNFIVHLKERDELVPYLVLDSDVQDGILVLRKELLPRKLSFNYTTPKESYIGTIVDDFLNKEFLNRFDENTLSKIEPINLYKDGEGEAKRKAFILEMDSIDYKFGSNINKKPMKYFIFNSEDKCPIKECNGEYFVFSRTIISDNTGLKVLAVKNDDTIVSLNQNEEGFIRPAMIFSKDTKVKLIKDEKFGDILVLDFN